VAEPSRNGGNIYPRPKPGCGCGMTKVLRSQTWSPPRTAGPGGTKWSQSPTRHLGDIHTAPGEPTQWGRGSPGTGDRGGPQGPTVTTKSAPATSRQPRHVGQNFRTASATPDAARQGRPQADLPATCSVTPRTRRPPGRARRGATPEGRRGMSEAKTSDHADDAQRAARSRQAPSY
jgi:hypothetical protein